MPAQILYAAQTTCSAYNPLAVVLQCFPPVFSCFSAGTKPLEGCLTASADCYGTVELWKMCVEGLDRHDNRQFCRLVPEREAAR